jgi:hypothetical protein
MGYTHPDALQRVCEEIDRTVWPLDRKFFDDNPQREFRIRPAEAVEIAEVELAHSIAVPIPPGNGAYILVRQFAPGVRLRRMIIVPVIDPWTEPPEAVARWAYRKFAPPELQAREDSAAKDVSGMLRDRGLV